MYFVDRNSIETTLTYMESLIPLMDQLQKSNTQTEELALERICYLMIESIIDVGNSMIDGFIMRDPGSYADIVDIMIDEKVISTSDGEALKQIILFRKEIIQPKGQIDHTKLSQLLSEHQQALISFPHAIRSYLENELGPVSAFLPNQPE